MPLRQWSKVQALLRQMILFVTSAKAKAASGGILPFGLISTKRRSRLVVSLVRSKNRGWFTRLLIIRNRTRPIPRPKLYNIVCKSV
jgi:hypothetical protein